MKKVTILALKNAVATSVAGPFDVFSQTGVMWNFVNGMPLERRFDVEVVTVDGQPIKCLSNIFIQPKRSMMEVRSPDLVLVASIANIDEVLENNPETVDWLRWHHGQGAHLAGVCTGVYLLAETGLLNGKTATTHWGFARNFQKRYPKINLKADRLITDEGDLFCSGGPSSGADLAFYLVNKYMGREVSLQCSKAMAHDFARRFQAPYSVFQLQKNHGDDTILGVQKYLEKNFHKPVNNASTAAKFGMSLRAFERRFKKATDDTPRVYLRRVRVDAAKRLLETSNLSFAEITFRVGYEDVSSFRRVFIKTVGLRPGEYKNKFQYAP
jgi:transcriptional regulator GlxA family with amidase domain